MPQGQRYQEPQGGSWGNPLNNMFSSQAGVAAREAGLPPAGYGAPERTVWDWLSLMAPSHQDRFNIESATPAARVPYNEGDPYGQAYQNLNFKKLMQLMGGGSSGTQAR